MLSRYLSGTCTDEERTLVKQWYNLKSSEEGSLADLPDLDRVQSEIWHNIRPRKTVIAKLKFKGVGIAASIALLVAFTIAFLSPGLLKRNTTTDWIKVSASNGKVVKLQLNDGSKVWLNAGSTLEYTATFGKEKRIVRLTKGEAFFDVTHDARKPFVVITDNLETQVLGTSFNIRSAAEMKKISVSVLRGKVAVTKKGAESLFLLPDEQALYDKQSGRILKSHVIAKDMNGWMVGIFRFHNEELEVITDELSRRYNLEFIYEDERMKTIRFNTGFKATDRLTDILNDLVKTGNIKYRMAAGMVIISTPGGNEK